MRLDPIGPDHIDNEADAAVLLHKMGLQTASASSQLPIAAVRKGRTACRRGFPQLFMARPDRKRNNNP